MGLLDSQVLFLLVAAGSGMQSFRPGWVLRGAGSLIRHAADPLVGFDGALGLG